jgi:FkbM family methyltransferase
MINQSPQQSIYKLLQGSTVTTIIDVGANVGQFGLDMRRAGFDGQIISYEPGQESFGLLRKTARNSEPWKISQIALGSAEAEKLINVSGNSGLSSSFLEMETDHLKHFPASITVKQEIAHVSTLDKQISGLGLDPKSILLKLDVQGYEFEVLNGARNNLSKIPFCYLEVSLFPLYKGEASWLQVMNFLAAAGHEVIDVYRGTETKHGELLQLDILTKLSIQ